MTARSLTSDARLRELARRIHALGERPLFELFRELDKGAPLRETLEVYARLDAGFIAALGGDKFSRKMFAIDGGRR